MARISTSTICAIVVALSVSGGTVATARPLWIVPQAESKSFYILPVADMPVVTNISIATPVKSQSLTTLKDRAIKTLESYALGHQDGDTSISSKNDDISKAVAIVNVLPSGIPVPTVMRNYEGEIGMYWDNDNVYIDINIDSDGSLSLFSRVRSTRQEEFLDGIDVRDIDVNWVCKYLNILSQNYSKAA